MNTFNGKKYLILRKLLSKASESPSLHLSNKQNIGKVNHPKHKTSALRFRYKQILILYRSIGYHNRLCFRFWNSFQLPSSYFRISFDRNSPISKLCLWVGLCLLWIIYRSLHCSLLELYPKRKLISFHACSHTNFRNITPHDFDIN